VVFDCCEHVIDAVAQLTGAIHRDSKRTFLLATTGSRFGPRANASTAFARLSVLLTVRRCRRPRPWRILRSNCSTTGLRPAALLMG
jgi:hypothetical protein